VYGVRFTSDGKALVSVGGAAQNRGFLPGLWNVADGKMLSGEELPLGTFFSVAVSNDGKFVAVGTGGVSKPAAGQDGVNSSLCVEDAEVIGRFGFVATSPPEFYPQMKKRRNHE